MRDDRFDYNSGVLAGVIAFLGLIAAAPSGYALCLGSAESAQASCLRFTESDPLITSGCVGTDLDEAIICVNPVGCVINGGGGNDVIVGAEGNDKLCGATRRDALDGLDGHDAMSGGFGLDALSGDDGNDVLFGDQGPDVLVGGPDVDVGNGGSTGLRNHDVCIQIEVTAECEVVFR